MALTTSNTSMKPITLLLVTTSVCAIVGCKSTAPEQPNYKPVGSFNAAPTDDDVRAAADAAVRSAFPDGKASLVSITKAERQVVAGLNYRMTLVVRHNGREATYATVVWRKLDGTHDIASWSAIIPKKKSDD
jgi:hypothetical protein